LQNTNKQNKINPHEVKLWILLIQMLIKERFLKEEKEEEEEEEGATIKPSPSSNKGNE